ncbi:hypothetical protein BL250_16515 [Erwinia sp. OLTSP20]|uniref:DUF2767 family protein n=1 Tax=unclassified Erwinia TaxID=2622719 RepID=UPI000C178268|nr:MULTISPECIES: DUF2767 family protein [unclassified Erwinia]PIJ48939.1 hypothetical protein BV501_14590 [Erwinia sp. OAMSP11]PIJ74593.1 hypothetical protein BK416_03795 [Erwinia sp. OLSSP12]PIJ79624.1 hypothetical protein BLD47_13215 [Erwinia sp. OLCASP19]PIJ80409.1 hypothetical protein BLD46_15060 [Erwinia sp. OLMTSP26]PIJ82524.1 hypothetical protein BLD49_14955 [Erwinia sp. OLMDSP33]
MHGEESEALYNEMCRIVGDAVFILCDTDVETKKYNIANALRTALSGDHGRTEYMRKAMEAAITVLER